MCGIYGIFSRTKYGLNKIDLEHFDQMGIVTQLRGMHSSGVFSIPPKTKEVPKIIKTVGPNFYLWHDKGWDAWQDYAFKQAQGIVGHGRAATKGKITKENAHPFRCKPITLVHNGTIYNGLDHHKGVDVDSHALCLEIQQKGVYEALHNISGAYAIIVYNEEEGKVYIARNSERPLHILTTSDRFYVMSEADALTYLAKRCKWGPLNKEPEVEYFEAGKVYSIEGGALIKEGEIQKKTYTPPYTPPPLPLSTHSQGYSRGGQTETITLPKYKKGDKIEFTTTGITGPFENTNVFLYVGTDEDKNFVCFQKEGYDETLKDRYGVGVCTQAKWLNGKWRYSVKTKSIAWDAAEKDDYVLLHGGEIYPKKEWEELVNDKTCFGCNEAIDPDKSEECTVIERGGKKQVMCPACVDTAISHDVNLRSIMS